MVLTNGLAASFAIWAEIYKTISNEDENMVIKYLLDIMKEHGIITDEEYIKVLYRYCQGV